MPVVTIKLEVDSTIDLEIASDLTSGSATFKIINSSNSNVILSGSLDRLSNLVTTYRAWEKFDQGKLKGFSKV